MARSMDRLRAFFAARGIDIQVHELSTSTRTAALAAEAVGSQLGEIVKSLVFVVRDDDGAAERAVLALVAGDRRADPTKVARAAGAATARIANATEVRAYTGYAIGGVAPVAHEGDQLGAVLVDDSLLRFQRVWAAAGAPHAVFPISLPQLLELTGGTVCDLAAPDPGGETTTPD